MNYMDRINEAFERNTPGTPMTKEDTIFFMELLMTKTPEISMAVDEVDKNSDFYIHCKDFVESFPAQVFLLRIKNLTTLKITLGTLLALLLYMKNAGNCVMYAYYMHKKLNPGTLVTLDVLSSKLFPWGFFSEEQLQNIWDAQKKRKEDEVTEQIALAKDNLLDYLETWKN